MHRWKRLVCLLGMGLPWFVAPSGRCDTTNLTVVADTYLVSDEGADNNAGAGALSTAGVDKRANRHRALFAFDLTGLPPSAVVTSAVFGFTVPRVVGITASPFNLMRMTASWGEGARTSVGVGSPAFAGETTWNHRYATTSAWASAGGDFEASPLGTVVISAADSYAIGSAALAGVVQGWIDQPGNNHGLLLMGDDEGLVPNFCQVGSREGGAAATLTIGYDTPTPPPPSSLTDIRVPATNLVLVWTNNAGRKYDVLFTEQLGGTQAWRIAEANLPAHPAGTNVWTDPPYLAGPLFPSNRALHYGLRELPASPTGLPLQLSVVVTGLVAPVSATHAGDGSGRLFVCEQRGTILIVDSNKTLVPAPFLDITASVTNLSPSYDERGLLGLAFHPGYETNRRFYVYYSAVKTGAGINHESRLSEFLCTATNANAADPGSERIVLRFDEPQSNHNGGSLAFGPDGYLYISTGDGGGAGDAHPPFGNGQNRSNLLGKILRIDVDGALPYAVPPDNPFIAEAGARPEIFAFGFRNPWKTAFDGTNCWVADVGQNLWEEINLLRKGGNFGWKILEGNHAFDVSVAATTGVAITSLDMPIHEYKHGPLGISITGGFVYRGTNYPALQGKYVFGDFSTSFGAADGALYYLDETRAGLWERFAFWMAPTGGRIGRYVKGFGMDEQGEIYLLGGTNLGPSGTSGEIRQLLPPP